MPENWSLNIPPNQSNYSKDLDKIFDDYFDDSRNNISYPVEAKFKGRKAVKKIIESERSTLLTNIEAALPGKSIAIAKNDESQMMDFDLGYDEALDQVKKILEGFK